MVSLDAARNSGYRAVCRRPRRDSNARPPPGCAYTGRTMINTHVETLDRILIGLEKLLTHVCVGLYPLLPDFCVLPRPVCGLTVDQRPLFDFVDGIPVAAEQLAPGASLAVSSGASVKHVQRMLGHPSAQ